LDDRAAERARWAADVEPLLAGDAEALWREHCDALNARLLQRWLPESPAGRLLKTDLWEEAVGSGLYPTLAARSDSVVGIDFSPAVVDAASARYPRLDAALADVRRLPFATGAFDVVVSTSTLDHFERRADIGVALAEIGRALRPGGQLLLTLDNLANPAVALRNALPLALLRRLRLVPYPVGATVGPRGLRRLVEAAGFDVLDTATLLHCPRALAIRASRRVRHRGSPAAAGRLLGRLAGWERLARLPTRHLTGYFVAIHARRR
jgi:SAM-dependent methyltransferase